MGVVLNDKKQQTLEGWNSWISVGVGWGGWWGAKRPETTDTRRAEFVDLGGGGVGWVVG